MQNSLKDIPWLMAMSKIRSSISYFVGQGASGTYGLSESQKLLSISRYPMFLYFVNFVLLTGRSCNTAYFLDGSYPSKYVNDPNSFLNIRVHFSRRGHALIVVSLYTIFSVFLL